MQTSKNPLRPQIILLPLLQKTCKLPLWQARLKRINADHNIFVTKSGLNKPLVSIFVNDIKIKALKDSGMIE